MSYFDSGMKKIGAIGTVIGVAYILIAFNMDVSAGSVGGRRVANLDLMERRQLHLIVACLITLVGIGLSVVGWLQEAISSDKSRMAASSDGHFEGDCDLSRDAYRLWLARRYDIQRNEVFDRFVIGDNTFEDLDTALAQAHSIHLEERHQQELFAQEAAEEESARREMRAEEWGAQKNLARAVAVGIAVTVTVGSFLYLSGVSVFEEQDETSPRVDANSDQSTEAPAANSLSQNDAAEVDAGSLASSPTPRVVNGECTGFYAHLDTSGEWPNGLSVEVGSSSVEVRFSDYGGISAQKLPTNGSSVRFSENGVEPFWALRCSDGDAILTIPADEWNDQRTFQLERSQGDIFEYALSKGYDIRH